MGRWRRADRALAVAILTVAAGASAESSSLAFARRGETLARLDRADLDAVAGARTLRVFEPYEGREVEFRVWPLAEVLDAVNGPDWRGEDELLFTCRDGYQPSVPVARLLSHDAYLAFERVASPDFAIDKRESGRVQRIPLAPYYVVWDNLDDETLRRDHDYGWPYQVVGIESIDAAEHYPAMAPPPESDAQVQAGFRDFRIHCSRCHALNGAGGAIGPELNTPAQPAGARDPEWLRRWIDDPAAFAATTRMPALNPALPDRAETLDGIVAYLQAMAAAATP